MRKAQNLQHRTWMTFGAVAVLAAAVSGCSQGSGTVTAPTPASSLAAKPSSPLFPDSTAVSFPLFDPGPMNLTIDTLTSSTVGQPYIDQGKIHLLILVDGSGNPLPCGSSGGTWQRIDNSGGGLVVSGAATSTAVDLDNLNSVNANVQNVHCGATLCIRAQYITGGGPTKVATHVADAPYTVTCGCGARGQGYWKTHASAWPVTSLMLGNRLYTQVELLQILNNPVHGNGLQSLAYQLIAAKLNIANGVSGVSLGTAIADADALIGNLVIPTVGADSLDPSITGALKDILEAFNTACESSGA